MAKPLPTHIPENVKARFWAKVDKRGPDECWPWVGAAVKGRGQIWCSGVLYLAPRIAKAIAGDHPASNDLFACHSCDNPACVNPAHIWWGDNKENMQDAARKGRNSMQTNPQNSFFAQPGSEQFRAKGQAHGRAKLTDENVRDIRAAVAGGKSQGAVAREYSVDPALVSLIVRKRIWKHV